MAKKVKIQRYDSKFRSSRDRRLRWIKGVLSLVAVALLFMLGWAVYDPVYEFLTNRQTPAPDDGANPSVSLPPETPSSSEAEAPQPADPQAEPKALYLPAEAFADAGRLQEQLALAKENGLDTVVLELKDEEGMLHFLTTNAQAASSGAVAPDAVALSAVAHQIADAGLQFGAQVQVFRDPLMAGAHKEWAVKYQNTDLNWLDNAADQGGKPWLNPYHAEACQYNRDIIREIIDADCTLLVLDGLQFPAGYALEAATYPGAGSTPKGEALSRFVASLDSGEGALRLSVVTPVAALLGDGEALFGGQPDEVFADASLTVTMIPSMLPQQVTVGESQITLPRDVPTALAAQLLAETGAQRLIPYLEATGGQQTATLRQALEAVGVTSYIFYSETGSYHFA